MTTRRRAFVVLGAVALALCRACAALAWPAPASAQDPIGGALATLAAATAQAQAVRAAQQATAQAIANEAARQRAAAVATQDAISAAATATAQAQSAEATRGALDDLARKRAASATYQALSVAATRQAQQAAATMQAGQVAASATAQALAIMQQERFTSGLLFIEIVGGLGALWVLFQLAKTLTAWAVRMRPRPLAEASPVAFVTSPAAQSPRVVIDQVTEQPARMPEAVRVVDDPRIVAALDRWAAEYDAQQGGNGNVY